jgi:hypothetical protein
MPLPSLPRGKAMYPGKNGLNSKKTRKARLRLYAESKKKPKNIASDIGPVFT